MDVDDDVNRDQVSFDIDELDALKAMAATFLTSPQRASRSPRGHPPPPSYPTSNITHASSSIPHYPATLPTKEFTAHATPLAPLTSHAESATMLQTMLALVAGQQETNSRIEALQQEVRDLRNENAALKLQLAEANAGRYMRQQPSPAIRHNQEGPAPEHVILIFDVPELATEEEDASEMEQVVQFVAEAASVAPSRILKRSRLGVKGDGKKKDGTAKHRPIRVALESREAWLSVMQARHILRTSDIRKLAIGEMLTKVEQERKSKRWPDYIAKREERLWVQWRKDVVWYRTPPQSSVTGSSVEGVVVDHKWHALKTYTCEQ